MMLGKVPTSGGERYTTRTVVFRNPFTLGENPEVYPAGAYAVETKEEAIDRAGYTAHVRTGTTLIIPTSTGSFSREVKGSELDKALRSDTERAGPAEPSENPDSGTSA